MEKVWDIIRVCTETDESNGHPTKNRKSRTKHLVMMMMRRKMIKVIKLRWFRKISVRADHMSFIHIGTPGKQTSKALKP